MKLKALEFKNFRNFSTLSLKLNDKINIFIGDNAQGKTSLIEGIYTLSTTKSHRTSKDQQMVKFDEDFARVKGSVSLANDEVDLSLVFSKKGKKAKYKSIEADKLSDFVGRLKTVFFAPEDLELIKGAPSIRRRFLNLEISQIDPLYLHHLTQYNQVLKQRNELLKIYQPNDQNDLMLEVLTEQLMPHMVYIYQKRAWFLSQLEKYAKTVHKFVTDDLETITFSYLPGIKVDKVSDELFYEKMMEVVGVDKRKKTTTIGIHRDDFGIELNGVNAHDFASQGQQRTSILSIKLAEIDLIQEETGEYPLLLLDDVLSELDEQRQTKLLMFAGEKTQTFITTTTLDFINQEVLDEATILKVRAGEILPGK